MRSALLLSLGLTVVVAAATLAGDEKIPQPSKDSYVKVRVEVEIRGVLSCTDKATTVTSRGQGFHEFSDPKDSRADYTPIHTLDFTQSKDLRELAKVLNGKEVEVTGKSELRLLYPPPLSMGGSTWAAVGSARSPYVETKLYVHPTVFVTGLRSVEKK